MKSSIVEGWFNDNHGVMTSKELLGHGLTYYAINKLLEDGSLYKIRRGIYGYAKSIENENVLIKKLIPKGVYCLQSAAFIHNYSMEIPLRYHIAVHSKANHHLPDYPPIKLYYWKDQQLEFGVIDKTIDGVSIRVYNKERTICDYFKFRSKFELNSIKEVVRSYLRDEDRDLIRLKKYSKFMRVNKILDHYLEVLI